MILTRVWKGYGSIGSGTASAADKAFRGNFLIFGWMMCDRKDQIVRGVAHTKYVNIHQGELKALQSSGSTLILLIDHFLISAMASRPTETLTKPS